MSIPLEKCTLFGKTCQVFPEKVTTVSGTCAVDIAASIMIPACRWHDYHFRRLITKVDYREIIRLKSAGYSNSSAASSTGSGWNKVAEVWMRAGEKKHPGLYPDP